MWEEVLLEHISEYGDLHFSVINGAQTITASAQCLYEMEYDLKECINKGKQRKRQSWRKDPSVEERQGTAAHHIFHTLAQAAESEADSTREVNEISVALNRQKPIKAEDIAFASPFDGGAGRISGREQMNGKRYFRLVKRGKVILPGAPSTSSILREPGRPAQGTQGDARSKGTNVLLSSRNDTGGEYGFQDKTIFVPEWLEAEDEQEAEIFEEVLRRGVFCSQSGRFLWKKM